MRSAPFLPEAVVFVESVGFRSPALFVPVPVCEGLEPDAVLYKMGKQCRQSKHPMMGAKRRKKKKYVHSRGSRCGRCRVSLGDGKLSRLSENGAQMLGIIDKVDLVATSDLESPTWCGDADRADTAVDRRNEDFRARWHNGLVLKCHRMRPK